MKRISILACSLIFFLPACNQQATSEGRRVSSAQNKRVGGGCDGCELMHEGIPKTINSVDTSAAWYEPGEKLLLTGTVYKRDGKTPAPGIILYYYHTDHTGHYSKRNDVPGNQTAHGHIRGWVKTDANGHYACYTSRPAPYPGDRIEAHIHVVIKEPGINEYYIDELVFDDDPILTEAKRRTMENRGGSGILKVSRSGDLQMAAHDIMLGLHIPDYPPE